MENIKSIFGVGVEVNYGIYMVWVGNFVWMGYVENDFVCCFLG